MNVHDLSAEKKFYDFLESQGHPLENGLNYDTSKFHAYKCPHGDATDARYKFFSDGIPGGYFKCWRCNIEADFFSETIGEVSPDKKNTYLENIKHRRLIDNEEVKKVQAEAANLAQSIWLSALVCESHPYLSAKQIKSFELRIKTDGTLLIPCFDRHDNLINLEQIFLNKDTKKFDKRPLKGGRRIGVFYRIGTVLNEYETVFLAEGYSTAATIFECTNAVVFISFNCGNLSAVAKEVRELYPKVKIIITADIDSTGVGEVSAKKACIDNNCKYITPSFLTISPTLKPEIKRSDFNDLFVLLMASDLNRDLAIVQVREQLISTAALHSEILGRLLKQVRSIDFREISQLPEDEKLRNNHYQIISIEGILDLAKANDWGLCRHHDFIYLYNGCYWGLCDEEELKSFLGVAAEKMGVDKFKAKHFNFRDQLYKQFLAIANLPKPEQQKDVVLINLQNGTFKITPTEVDLLGFNRANFITYQLPFAYDPTSKAVLFQQYLDTVLPDKNLQNILSEYLGYVFIRPTTLKLEKALLLYGRGANGKSVFYEIVRSLLGDQNTSEYSLQSLTNDNGYFRAMLANKLVNYSSEISGKLEASIFKQLASGEPIEARLPYGEPFILTQYAKMIFNCNELPKDVEQTEAYFRRFLIVPFEVTIPEEEQDKQLAQKIIRDELSGVFNWVLQGLQRLLEQKKFTSSDVVKKTREQYERESDSVRMFLHESDYKPSVEGYIEIKILYIEYRTFCMDDGFKPVNKSNFMKRLGSSKICLERKNFGWIAYLGKQYL